MSKPPSELPANKPSLILPSDPAFYELPPPPGGEPEPSFEDLLGDLNAPEAETSEGRTPEGPAVHAVPVIPGACDSHVHVVPDPSFGDYAQVQAALGVERVVLVQSSAYGFDHAVLSETLQDLGVEAARGVAAVGPEVSDGELSDLDAIGCVATRFQMRDRERLIDWTATDRLANRVHDTVQWDVDLQMDGRFLMEVEERVRAWPGRVVLDHLGCFLGPVGDRDPGMRALLRLIDADKVWVKLSGPEAIDPDAPHYRNAERIARLLIGFAPERLVWGSNWPHASAVGAAPDTGALLALLGEWCDDDGVRDRILVDNAAELWRFPAVGSLDGDVPQGTPRT